MYSATNGNIFTVLLSLSVMAALTAVQRALMWDNIGKEEEEGSNSVAGELSKAPSV